MQKKSLLSKVIIPIALTLFSSGCYSVFNLGREEDYISKKKIVEANFGWGSYYGEHFYRMPGYISFFNLDIYGNLNSKFRHQEIHNKPFWENRTRNRIDFQKPNNWNLDRPRLRNNEGQRNNRRNR